MKLAPFLDNAYGLGIGQGIEFGPFPQHAPHLAIRFDHVERFGKMPATQTEALLDVGLGRGEGIRRPFCERRQHRGDCHQIGARTAIGVSLTMTFVDEIDRPVLQGFDDGRQVLQACTDHCDVGERFALQADLAVFIEVVA
uniref:Uncharacterized protein n=1 Tax=Bradyrhizobium quebecense TaxID=2748629 RepID=A0ABS3MVR7_9BRAD